MPPAVSVVMCVFQPDPRLFGEAVRSVLFQTEPNLELVIVEDPSASRTSAVLQAIGDERVRHILNRRRTSLIDQRNRGFHEARADYVAVLDADDLAEPHRFEEQRKFLERNCDAAVVGSQINVIDQDGQVVGHRHFPVGHAQILRAMHRVVAISQPSAMFRRCAVLSAGGYQSSCGEVAEDYELYSRMAQRGARLANHPDALTRYRLHSNQAKARRLRETIRAVLRVKRRYWLRSMNLGDRLRMYGEMLMLPMPQPFVLAALRHWQYRDVPSGAESYVGERCVGRRELVFKGPVF